MNKKSMTTSKKIQEFKKITKVIETMNPFARPGGLDAEEVIGPLEYLHYGRTMFLDTPISRPECHFIPKLLMFDNINREPIKIFVSSPGGEIDAGFQICDAMELVRSKIITIGMGFQSMAVPIFTMGDERFLFPHARVMIHLPWAQVMGDESQIAIASKQMTRMKERIADLMIKRGVKKSRKQVLKDMEKDFWMEADEAIKYGIAHKVITQKDYQRIFFGGKQ